ncbi:MAG: hypothetical protein ACLP50_18510 [Solirubrobacteraceae bacterium]
MSGAALLHRDGPVVLIGSGLTAVDQPLLRELVTSAEARLRPERGQRCSITD